MTIQEYIQTDRPFFHITATSNLHSILETGLEARRCGICVVRSDSENVLKEVISQINNTNQPSFAIIKITPSKHNIKASIVCEDSADELIAPLQNYIVIDRIIIDKSDIYREDYFPTNLDRTITDDEIERLTGYQLQPRPEVPDFLLE